MQGCISQTHAKPTLIILQQMRCGAWACFCRFWLANSSRKMMSTGVHIAHFLKLCALSSRRWSASSKYRTCKYWSRTTTRPSKLCTHTPLSFLRCTTWSTCQEQCYGKQTRYNMMTQTGHAFVLPRKLATWYNWVSNRCYNFLMYDSSVII